MKTLRGKTKQFIAVLLMLAVCMTQTGVISFAETVQVQNGSKLYDINAETASQLSNPRTDENGVVTWDCVYFGNYPQSDATGATSEPIKWRVLQVNGNDAFLQADVNLDCQPYNETWTDVTWETCTLRSWLNNTFLNKAFTASEQSAITTTNVVNEDNPEHGTEGGNNTNDKVFLLSLNEVRNSTYGFPTDWYEVSATRRRVNTAYAKAQGAYTYESYGTGWWWLRSPGDDSDYAADVSSSGCGQRNGYGVVNGCVAVCPALHLNLSSTGVYSYAGTVTSEGGSSGGSSGSVTTQLSNPRTDENGVVTWDCVYFGNYPQSDATGATSEPIKWRVLQVNGNDAFLQADVNLDVQPYHDTYATVTWETCTLRSWLNDSFFNKAFTAIEQNAITTTNVINENNVNYGTEGGNDTQDKIYLLSISEATNPKFGFCESMETNNTRERINTKYVSAGGTYVAGGETLGVNPMKDCGETDQWWLRSPGESFYKAFVQYKGYITESAYGSHGKVNAVCPALHLNLSSTGVYSYAGTVTSEGGSSEQTPSVNTEFNQYIYRANILTGLTKSQSINWDKTIHEQAICEQLVTAADQKGMHTSAKAWKALQNVCKNVDSPSNAIDMAFEEKDMYDAIVLAVLSKTQESSMPFATERKIFDKEKELWDLVATLFEDEYIFNNLKGKKLSETNWKSLTQEQQLKIMDTIEDSFKEKNPDIENTNKVFKAMNVIVKTANTVEDVINYVVSYVTLYQMNDAQKQIVRSMYEECGDDNPALKRSLRECEQMLDTTLDQFTMKLINGSCQIVGREVTKAWIDVYWDEVKKTAVVSNPYLLFLIASYKGSTYVSNALFGTDEIVEKYFNMVAMRDFEELAENTYASLMSKYKNEKNEWNASVYLAAVDMMYQALDKDYQYGIDYASAVDNTLASKLSSFMGNTDVKDMINVLKIKQTNCKANYIGTLTTWIDDLVVDYPEEYEKYKHLFDDETNESPKTCTIACPVDVYIYDTDNNLAGSIVSGRTTVMDDKLTLVLRDDVKKIYFSEKDYDYVIRYVGTDSGFMDVAFSEESDSGQRNVLFNQIPLTNGIEFTSHINDDITGNAEYTLVGKDNQIKVADFDSSDNLKEEHRLTIINGMGYQNEMPAMELEVKAGEMIEISALTGKTEDFLGWEIIEGDGVIADKLSIHTQICIGDEDCIVTAKTLQNNIEDSDITNQNASVAVSSITIKAPSKKLAAGKKVQFSAELAPNNATNKVVTWTSSNPKYATVDANGMVSIKKAGAGKSVTITATAKDGSGKSASCKVKIMQDAVKKIKLSAQTKTVKAGKSIKIKASVTTTGKKANKSLKWTSSNTAYATVNAKGKVVTKKAGKGKTVTITAESTDGSNKKAKIKLKIK